VKKILFFILGVIVGGITSFMLIYASGFLIESLGMILYESEADQQRNFNYFIIFSAIFAIGGGRVFLKKFT